VQLLGLFKRVSVPGLFVRSPWRLSGLRGARLQPSKLRQLENARRCSRKRLRQPTPNQSRLDRLHSTQLQCQRSRCLTRVAENSRTRLPTLKKRRGNFDAETTTSWSS